MANKKKSGAPSPGGRGGNVVVDLGEEVDGMIHHAFKTGYAPKGSKGLGAVRRPTGFRPSFLSNSGFGFRPSFHRSQLGLAVGLPSTVDPMRTLGGAFAGVAANRVLYRLIPWVGEKLKVGITSKLAVDALSAAIGVLPFFLAKKNSFTVGFAIPGLINVAGSVVDWGLTQVGFKGAALSGVQMGQAGSVPALAQARQTIDRIRSRMAQGTPIQVGGQPVRVQALAR